MTFQVFTPDGREVASFTANRKSMYDFIIQKYPDHIVHPDPEFGITLIEEED
jgi:hypothetical protein